MFSVRANINYSHNYDVRDTAVHYITEANKLKNHPAISHKAVRDYGEDSQDLHYKHILRLMLFSNFKYEQFRLER